MPSFQITLTPKRRAAARMIADVRRALQRSLADKRHSEGLTQSEVARRLDIHRSVVSRELAGRKDIGVGRIGEFAWALGLEPYFELRKPEQNDGQNVRSSTSLDGEGSAPVTQIDDINKCLQPLAA